MLRLKFELPKAQPRNLFLSIFCRHVEWSFSGTILRSMNVYEFLQEDLYYLLVASLSRSMQYCVPIRIRLPRIFVC